MRLSVFLCLVIMMFIGSSYAQSVAVAPRISDKEIIESLAELKAGQREQQKMLEEHQKMLTEQQKVLEELKMGQKVLAEQVKILAEQVKMLGEQDEKRLGFIESLLLVLITSVFGLVGFIVWDRYSTLRPMDTRIRRIEEDLERDLELKSPEGSRLTRLIHALRELAKTDKQIAALLKEFHLL